MTAARSTRSGSRVLTCAVMAFGIPFGIIAILAVILYINNRPPNIAVPTPKMPVPNAWDDFVRAGEMIGTIKHWGPLSDPNTSHVWTIPEYEAFVRANAPALALVREGLAKPYLHPPVRDLAAYSSLMGYHTRLRDIARILGGEAEYYRKVGKFGKAADSHLDCIELGVMMPRGGGTSPNLVGSAIKSIGRRHFAPVLAKIGPRDMERAAKRLERMQKKRVPYHEIVLEDGRSSAATWEESFRSPDHLGSLMNLKSWYEDDWLLSGGGRVSGRIRGNLQFAFCNKSAGLHELLAYYEAFAAEQRGPYTGKSSVPEPHTPLAGFAGIGPAEPLLDCRAIHTRNEALLRLIQAEVALRRYRAEHGRYPDRLIALVPKYLKSVPTDPFGLGKPLCYKPLDGGKSFLLYSRGPNLKDDGGKHGEWSGRSSPGDIVAGKC